MKSPRLILVGLDGAMPEMIERFLPALPNFRRLMEQGFFAPAWSSPTCDTPTNWTTIATGSWTATHGITSFNVHLPGTPVTAHRPTFNSTFCRSEYLWQAAERQGLRPVVLNWPGGWPVRVKDGVVVGGDAIISWQWRVAPPLSYHTRPVSEDPNGLVELGEAGGWSHVPQHSRALETAVSLAGGYGATWSSGGLEIESVEAAGTTADLRILVLDPDGSGYRRVIVSPDKDAAHAVADLCPGDWSDWIIGRFGGSRECAFRLKLVELSRDGSVLNLCRSTAEATSGWAYPEAVAQDLVREAGPFVEGLECLGSMPALAGEETEIEQLEIQCDWMVRAARHLIATQRCDILLMQLHSTDGLNHRHLARVCPESSKYDAAEADPYWDLYRRNYAVCDRMIGRIMDECAGPDTVVAVVSDHGCVYVDKIVWLPGALLQRGLVAYKPGQKPGTYDLDTTRSRVRPTAANYIWVNLKGREKGGIVEPGEEYERVCQEAIQALYSLEDPQTGQCPVQLALKTSEARHLGQHGPNMPDIIYFLRPGYTDYPCGFTTLDFSRGGMPDARDLIAGGGFALASTDGHHHVYLPYAGGKTASNRAIFALAGPGVRRGSRLEHVDLVDVAPTLCRLIGIQPPAQSEGRVVEEALE